MLIPLGILASSGGAAAGDYQLISTAYGSGSSGTITFSDVPSTYKHLQVRAVGLSTDTGYSATTGALRFNSDTGSNYSRHDLSGNGSAVYSSAGTSQTSISALRFGGSYISTDIPLIGIMDILDYASTSKNKTIRSFTGGYSSGNYYVTWLISGAWYSTSAINSLSISLNAGSFSTKTRVSLYGIKG